MSLLRQKLGGYKLVGIRNYNDVSYMSPWEIENIGGIAYSYWDYQSKSGKTVTRVVKGHWNFKKQIVISDKTLKTLINLLNPVLNETKTYKTQDAQVKLMKEVVELIKEEKSND